jgi:tryptophan synthase alpha chain
MSRIDATLAALKAQGRKALIPYVMAGFPQANITPALMHGMVDAGADIIELGVPFSDPMADGAVIQKAGEAALRFGIGTAQVLDMVREFRKTNNTTPVVQIRSSKTPLLQAWTACSSSTTHRKSAKSSPPPCARTAWT